MGKAQAWTGRVTNNLTGQAEQLKGKFAGHGTAVRAARLTAKVAHPASPEAQVLTLVINRPQTQQSLDSQPQGLDQQQPQVMTHVQELALTPAQAPTPSQSQAMDLLMPAQVKLAR